MKTKRVDAAGNNILLSGEIDANFRINPGNRILLENGATFKGAQVGGQILYNDEYVVKVFSLTASGEIELVPELLQPELDDEADAPRQSDFLTLTPHSAGLEQEGVGEALSPLEVPRQVSYPIEELSLILPPKPLARLITIPPDDLPPARLSSREQECPRLTPEGEEEVASPLFSVGRGGGGGELSLPLSPVPLTRSVTWSELPPVILPSKEQEFSRLSPASEEGEEEVASPPVPGLHREPTTFWVKGEELIGASNDPKVLYPLTPKPQVDSPTSEDGVSLFSIAPQPLIRSISVVPDMSELGSDSQGQALTSSLPREEGLTPPIPGFHRKLTPFWVEDEDGAPPSPTPAVIHVALAPLPQQESSGDKEKLSLREVLGSNLSPNSTKSAGLEVQVVGESAAGENHSDMVKADPCCGGCILL